MAVTIKHAKTDTIADWTQADLDAQIALGNFPPGTLLADIVLPSDWNNDHTISGTLAIANGGTGQTTANAAINALLPSQTSQSGKVLSTDGTNTSWIAAGGTGTVTSVALTAPSIFSVSGSPITAAGTLALTYSGTALPVANGGSGATTLTGYVKGNGTSAFTASATVPSTDITGLGTMSTQNANSVTITGGTVNGTTIGATTATTGAFTTLTASTSLTTPTVQATNSGGLSLKNSAGTTQMSMGAGGGDNISLNVSTNLNGSNAQIDISPTGTGHVHINPTGSGSIQVNPTSVGTIDNMTIGATIPKNGSFVDFSVTGTTSFDGSQGTAGQVLTSAGTGATPTWTTPAAGTVTSVTGTAPVVSSGGTTPAISMAAASSTVNGYLTSTDWNTFNSKGSGTVTSVSATSPVTSTGGATPTIAMPAATTSVSGYLTSTDWTTFNNKGNGTVTSVAALTLGTTGTDLSSSVATGTTTPVITLNVPTASATNRGALSSADWTTFNNKGSGTVTSVAVTAPSIFSVAGSPITSSGTIALTYSGTALPIANGGTGQTTASAAFNALSPLTTAGDILYGATSGAGTRLGIGTVGQVLTVSVGGLPTWSTMSAGLGTVTSVSVVSANGFAGTVATATTTPAITISTSITGILSGNGTAISAASTTGSGSVVLATSPTLTTATTSGVFTLGGSLDETVYAVVDAAGVALTPQNGTIQTWTLGASRTPTSGTWNAGESMTLMINDGTAYTVTWTTLAVTWVGGTAPTLATTGFTVIELWKVGTTIYGALVGSVA